MHVCPCSEIMFWNHLFSTYRALLRSHIPCIFKQDNAALPHALPLAWLSPLCRPAWKNKSQTGSRACLNSLVPMIFEKSSQNWTWRWNNQAHVSLNLGFAWRQNMAANADKKRRVQYELGLLTLRNQSKSPLWTIIPLFLLLIPPNTKN